MKAAHVLLPPSSPFPPPPLHLPDPRQLQSAPWPPFSTPPTRPLHQSKQPSHASSLSLLSQHHPRDPSPALPRHTSTTRHVLWAMHVSRPGHSCSHTSSLSSLASWQTSRRDPCPSFNLANLGSAMSLATKATTGPHSLAQHGVPSQSMPVTVTAHSTLSFMLFTLTLLHLLLLLSPPPCPLSFSPVSHGPSFSLAHRRAPRRGCWA